MKFSHKIIPFILSINVLLAMPAWGAWQLNNAHSSFNFMSIKKFDIAEVHRFTSLSGILSDNQLVFSVDLTSVDTNITIRDERMKEHLFDIGSYTQAQFRGTLDEQQLVDLETGTTTNIMLSGIIELHGEKQSINTQVVVAKLTYTKILVSALHPIVIDAQAFALAEGIAKLQALAGLPHISKAVPVTFVLMFELKPDF